MIKFFLPLLLDGWWFGGLVGGYFDCGIWNGARRLRRQMEEMRKLGLPSRVPFYVVLL